MTHELCNDRVLVGHSTKYIRLELNLVFMRWYHLMYIMNCITNDLNKFFTFFFRKEIVFNGLLRHNEMVNNPFKIVVKEVVG